MIIVELSGGLGNQMFEYALGRQLSILNKSELKLYLGMLEVDPLRDFALQCFNISCGYASEEEARKLKYGFSRAVPYMVCHVISKILGKLNLNSPFCRPTFITEKQTVFRPEILNLTGDVFLSGYWQTEKYFSSIRNLLLQEFSFKSAPDDENKKVIDLILAENSVSVHIRRGDYISNPTTHRYHNCCDESYYQRAMAEVCKQVSQPHFFVISDEPEWAQENFKAPGEMSIIDLNHGERSYEDMRLMSLCKHNVIANSSFSWWGAWLNQNPEKIVIAPKHWFNFKKFKIRDLIPEQWHIL